MTFTLTRVTWYSQIAAIVLFVLVWVIGYYIGQYSIDALRSPAATFMPQGKVVSAAAFTCDRDQYVSTIFYDDGMTLTLSDGRTISLPQAISASGARYANVDESFVFWNKGNTAFITEQGTTTYEGCVTK